jgi:predicted DCC family thiol-disulfide oxidoreductase YuxK
MNTFPVVRFVFGGQEATRGSAGRPYTVVWDGTCTTCARLVTLLEKWDTRDHIETIPSQNTSVFVRFPWIPAEAYSEAMQLIGPGGKTWQGAEAIEQLLRILPLGRPLSWVFRIPLVGGAIDAFYRWFARNRFRFGCGEHCQVRPARLDFHDADPAGDTP